MVLPVVGGAHSALPPGRHQATLDELRDHFVTNAPFTPERALVFQAFETWLTLVDGLLPGSRYWVNGGFVTHKPWAAPSDIDVVVVAKRETLNALSEAQQAQFESLLTDNSGSSRIQPMGGLIDGFYTIRGSVGQGDPAYWHQQWSQVTGPDKKPVAGAIKGFVEVIL